MEKRHYTIPQTSAERNSWRERIHRHVEQGTLCPPLSLEALREEVAQLLQAVPEADKSLQEWLMVELHNQVWKATIATIPYERRILLLPKCLSHSKHCQAEVDELGLLCHRCHHCPIPDLEERAEQLGMLSIVAEGFTSVVGLIQNRVVDAVIGVSCLDSLEKAFPLLIRNAVPGLAIPLNFDGCKDTQVDEDYVLELMQLRDNKPAQLLDYDGLRSQLNHWFTPENLNRYLSPAIEETGQIVKDWIGGEGKRWRPYLLAATYLALTGETEVPESVCKAAIAIECFHKASLIHDDIQDQDAERYGKPTVNATYGVPMAINVGDLLLGEGYRLLAAAGDPRLLQVASEAHIALCQGQGMELAWSRNPQPFDLSFVIAIFTHKTVPAFEVSLQLGLLCAGSNPELAAIFHQYATQLGIVYQLLDDLADFDNDAPLAIRPSAVLAQLCAIHPDTDFQTALFNCADLKEFLRQPAHQPYLQEALTAVREMADHLHQEALRALHPIQHVELKRLLFRVTERILR